MPRGKSTVEYVAINDLTKPINEQSGYVLVVEGRGGYTDKNRQKALELALHKYSSGELPIDKFPDGLTLEHILPDADSGSDVGEIELLPIQVGAREAADLARLQADVQDAIEEVMPYQGVLEKLKDLQSSSLPMLTNEEKEQVLDKNFSKALHQMASAIANQSDYQQQCSGSYKLIIDIISEYKRETSSIKHNGNLEKVTEGRQEVKSNHVQNGK